MKATIGPHAGLSSPAPPGHICPTHIVPPSDAKCPPLPTCNTTHDPKTRWPPRSPTDWCSNLPPPALTISVTCLAEHKMAGCHFRETQKHCKPGRSLRDQIFFFVQGPPLRTAPRHHQPLTANCHQPPTATNRQPRPTANRQPLPTTTNHPSPTANRRQPPTANRQSPPAANRQSPPTMVEHMSYTRSFLKKACTGTVFFFPLRTALLQTTEETGRK